MTNSCSSTNNDDGIEQTTNYLLHKHGEENSAIEILLNDDNDFVLSEEIHLHQALDGSMLYQSLRNLSLRHLSVQQQQQQRKEDGAEDYHPKLINADHPSTLQSASYTDTSAYYEKVLQEIDEIQEKRRNAGLSEINFTSGVLNVLVITYVFGAYPQHFWILYIVESFYFIPYKFALLWNQRPLRGVCYLLDFCWVINIMGVLLLLMFSCYSSPFVALTNMRKEVFMATFGICCGPLLGATAALPFVAFVFHDVSTMTGLFIHVLPPMLMYTLRWHGDKIQGAYPQIFQLDYFEDMRFFPSNISGEGSIAGNATLVYVSWLIPYICWMLLQGLDLPRKTGKKSVSPTYDTVFHSFWRQGLCETCGSLLWNRPVTVSKVQMEHDDYETRDFLLYMMGHAILVCTSILTLANICRFGPLFHGILLFCVVTICVYRGAQRYTYYVTIMYGKIVRKQLGIF